MDRSLTSGILCALEHTRDDLGYEMDQMLLYKLTHYNTLHMDPKTER